MVHHHGFPRHTATKTYSDSCKALLVGYIVLSALILSANAIHHLQEPPVHLVNRQNSDKPLVVTNNCEQTIYPGILTQAGTGPDRSGFRLEAGGSLSQTVGANWRGRVWGRTNCSFSDDGTPASGQGGAACSSGDCGAFVECQGAVSMQALPAKHPVLTRTGQSTSHSSRIHPCLQLKPDLLRHFPGRWVQSTHGYSFYGWHRQLTERHPAQLHECGLHRYILLPRFFRHEF